jgi:mannose-6-phosphate isomerase-like protein (cupin superfamily)
MRSMLCVLLLVATPIALADDYWSAADLDAFAAALSKDPSAGPGRLIDRDRYFAAISHREPGPGFSEMHRDWADVYFVSSGRATLVTGGTIVAPKESAPGEIRGTAIDGGTRRTIAEGDVVHIPPGTPHHVIVESGNELTYFLLKVRGTD